MFFVLFFYNKLRFYTGILFPVYSKNIINCCYRSFRLQHKFLSISRSTIQRARDKFREKHAEAHQSSVHSEDSTSSKEDRKKKDDLSTEDLELEFSQKEEKCLTHLRGIGEVSSEVIKEIDFIFKKYNDILTKEKKARIKAEAELFYKLEKMAKYLQSTTGLQEEVNHLKQDLDKKEGENLCLKYELDEAHKREQDLYDENKGLVQKIEQLDRDLDRRQLEDKIKEGDVKGKTRENYIKEIGRLKRELDVMEGRLFQCQSECKTLERKLREKEKEYADMEEMVKSHKYDVMKHEQKRKVVESDLEKALNNMDDLKRSISKHYETFKKAVHELTKIDEENFELKKTKKGLDEQQMVMSKYIIELRDRLEYLSKVYFEVEDQNIKLKALCSNQTGTLDVIKKKSIDVDNFQDKWLRRLDLINKKRKAALAESKQVNRKLMQKMKEIKHYELVAVKLNKRIKELQKEKDICSDNMKKILVAYNKEKEKTSIQEQLINRLQEESDQFKSIISRQQQEIEELYKYSNIIHKDMKSIEGENKIMAVNLQAAILQLINSKKQMKKSGKDLNDISVNYDNIFIEKKTLEGRLIESKSLAKDREFKIRHLCDEITKYKQQMDNNDDLVTRLQRKLKRVEFDYTYLNKIFKQGKLENQSLHEGIFKKEKEKEILALLISKGEKRKNDLTKEVNKLRRKISSLKTAMDQKDSEVKLVYEKTELLRFITKGGESAIRQRQTEIKLLKSEILKLRGENNTLKKIIESNVDLQREIISLRKDLSLSKQKCRALEEQMENPINVHRWRILKGHDPEKNELIEKNQMLLRKLLHSENKNNELKEQYHSLEEAYMNFKKQIENVTAGNECVFKLQETKRSLRNKTLELQRLSIELGSYQRELKELKKEMEGRKIKADECMKKYYELKKVFDEEKMSKSEKKTVDKVDIKQSPGQKMLGFVSQKY